MANLLEEARNLMPGRGRSHWSLDEARHPAYSEGSPYMTFLRALHQTVKAGMSQLRGKHEVRLSPADTEFTQHLVVQGFGPKGALPVASRFFIDGTWLAKDKPGSGGHYVQATGARKTWNMKGEDPARLGKHLGAAMLKSLKSRGMGESLDEGVAAGMPKTLRVVKGNKKFGIDKHSTLHVMSIEPFETGAKLIVQGRINKQAGKTALWVRYMKHLKERDTFNLAKGDGINKIVVQVMKRAEGAKTESIVGAAGPFAISDAPAPTPQEQVADLLDRVRSPRWEYPSWALPKVKLDEVSYPKGVYAIHVHRGHGRGTPYETFTDDRKAREYMINLLNRMAREYAEYGRKAWKVTDAVSMDFTPEGSNQEQQLWWKSLRDVRREMKRGTWKA